MLVAGAGTEPTLLDFFVGRRPRPPGEGPQGQVRRAAADRRVLRRRRAGVPRRPGLVRGLRRPGRGLRGGAALGHDAARRSSPRRRPRSHATGVLLNAGQAYVAQILAELLTSTPECAALWAPDGRVLREGEVLRNPELADALELLGARGAEPFYRGTWPPPSGEWLGARGGLLAPADLAAYQAIEREPVRIRYRDREILTNPPPSAGGTLLAYALALLDRGAEPAGARRGRGGDGGGPVRAHAGVRRGSPGGGLLRALPRPPARLDHPHLGARRRRARVQRDVHQRRGLGRGRARDRNAPEQRDGRGGPQPARLPPPPRPPADAEHDGPDGGDARRRGRAGARQRGLQPHPLGAAADDRGRGRSRPRCAEAMRRAAGALRGRRAVRRAGHRAGGLYPTTCRSCASARSTCSSAASRRRSAVAMRWSGAGDPRRGGVAVQA